MTMSVGLGEAPDTPPDHLRLRFSPDYSPRRLLGAVIVSVWPWVLAGSLLESIAGVAMTALPVWLGHTIDTVITPATTGTAASQVWASFLQAFGWLVALYLVITSAQRFGGRLGYVGMQRAQHELSQVVVAHGLSQGTGGRLPGEWVANLTAAIRRTCEVLYVLVYPPGEGVRLMATTVILWAIHPALAITVMVVAPLVFLVMRIVGQPLEDRIMEELDALGDAVGVAADTMQGYRTLAGLHAQHTAATRYTQWSQEALRTAVRARGAEARFDGIQELIGGCFAAVLVGLGVWLTVDGQLSVGQLATVAGLSLTIIGALGAIVEGAVGVWASAQGAARQVLNLTAPAGKDADRATPVPLPIHPGEFTVIQGAEGRHPAVIAGILAAHPTALIAPYPSSLLHGSVLDNVQACGPTPAPASVAVWALAQACLDAAELVDGYATQTGDNGSRLSGGQRQRVALARALAAKPETLVLINPTSSVDTATAQAIAAKVRLARRGLATAVLTDSPAFAAVATQRIELPV